MNKLLLTVPEAAELAGIGRSTMYALLMSHTIPSITIGRSRRVLAADVEAFVVRLRADAVPA